MIRTDYPPTFHTLARGPILQFFDDDGMNIVRSIEGPEEFRLCAQDDDSGGMARVCVYKLGDRGEGTEGTLGDWDKTFMQDVVNQGATGFILQFSQIQASAPPKEGEYQPTIGTEITQTRFYQDGTTGVQTKIFTLYFLVQHDGPPVLSSPPEGVTLGPGTPTDDDTLVTFGDTLENITFNMSLPWRRL